MNKLLLRHTVPEQVVYCLMFIQVIQVHICHERITAYAWLVLCGAYSEMAFKTTEKL